MERAARPATVEDLKQLVEHLNRESVDYLLIGGFALMALGYQRGTTDIDLLLPRDPGTGERIKRALLYLPDQAARELKPEWFAEDEAIRVADEIVIDLLFTASGETYDSLLPHAVTVDLGGVTVRTLDIEGLLKTKQSARDKDKLDRLILEQALAELRRK
ncbi:MAG: hypothetical protein HYY28_08280 [Betaproteobacteria bacterium]|nr:hypothetical protein [Betaproteobacteria bacterium]